MARGAEWREPAEYSFVLDSRCSDQPLLGRFRISVADGVVGEAVGLDNAARNALAGGRHGLVPTLGWLLDEVDAARRGGADVAQVEFDTVDGHPVHIAIDFDSAALDDEECYTITDYAVLPRASNDPPDQH